MARVPDAARGQRATSGLHIDGEYQTFPTTVPGRTEDASELAPGIHAMGPADYGPWPTLLLTFVVQSRMPAPTHDTHFHAALQTRTVRCPLTLTFCYPCRVAAPWGSGCQTSRPAHAGDTARAERGRDVVLHQQVTC